MLIIKVFAAALLFLTQVVPARIMSIEQFGMYSYLLSIVTVMSFVVLWGLDKSVIKLFSLRDNKDKNEISNKMFGVWVIVLINSVFFGTLISFYISQSLETVYLSNIEILIVLCLLVISLARISASVTKGINKVIESEMAFNIIRPAIFSMALIAFYYVNLSVSLYQVITVLLISYLISFIVTTYISHQSVNLKFNYNLSSIPLLYKYSFAFLFVSIGSPLIANIDLLQLGSMAQPRDIALYSVASKIVNLVLLGLVSANLLIAPKIAPLYYDKRQNELYGLIRGNNKFVLGLTIIPIASILLFTEHILLLFGEQYGEAGQIVTLLLVGQSISVLCGPVLLVSVMLGLQKKAAIIVLSSCGAIWFLCDILIPLYGTIGAAYANIFGYGFMNMVLAYYVYKHTGLNVTMTNLIVRRVKNV